MRIASAPTRLLRRVLRNTSGAAYIEFALIAPTLLLMYCGSYVVSDMVTCARKVSLTAHTMADLTSQYGTVNSTQLSAVMTNSAYTLAPYSSSGAVLRISEVQVATASTATVVWSQAQNGTALAVGTTISLPSNLAPTLMVPSSSNNQTGAYFVMSEISYPYTPAFGGGWLPSPTLYNRYFMVPRISNAVTLGS